MNRKIKQILIETLTKGELIANIEIYSNRVIVRGKYLDFKNDISEGKDLDPELVEEILTKENLNFTNLTKLGNYWKHNDRTKRGYFQAQLV